MTSIDMDDMKFRWLTTNDNTYRIVTKDEKDEDDKFVYHFVLDLLKNMVGRCKAYSNFNKYYSYPYTFGERQLDSILLPALSEMCHGKVLTEYPIERIMQNADERSSGRVDYVCVYRGRTIVIEVKHDQDSFKSSVTSQTTINRWNVMVDYQLQSVKSQLRKLTSTSSSEIVRLGLQFITSKSDQQPSKELINEFFDNVDDIIERLYTDLYGGYKRSKPDLAICWIIPAKMVEDCLDTTYVGLSVIAKYKYDRLKNSL